MEKNGDYSIIKYIGIALATGAILLPVAASAATVQIYTTVTNAHGGALFGADLAKCISTGNIQQECIAGPATFTVPAGPYEVTPVVPAGYSAALSTGCAGTISSDETAACHIDWSDGAPIRQAPASVAPTAPPQSAPVPATASTKSKLTLEQAYAIIGLLRAFGVDEATVKVVEGILI